MANEGYMDVRQSLWRESFEQATGYEEYLEGSKPKHRDRWLQAAAQLPELEPADRARVTGYHRELRLLLVSGIWCGDCVRQGPVIQQVVEQCDDEVRLRVIDRDLNEDLRDEVRILGALRVPVLVALTEDYFEVGRFGDRTLSTYRQKAIDEVGASCPLPTGNADRRELREIQSQWLDVIERWILMARLSPQLRGRHED